MYVVGFDEGRNVVGSTVGGFTAGARVGVEVWLLSGLGGLGSSGGNMHVTLILSVLGNQ